MPYLLFSGPEYDCPGGMYDYERTFPSALAAKQAFERSDEEDNWAHVAAWSAGELVHLWTGRASLVGVEKVVKWEGPFAADDQQRSLAKCVVCKSGDIVQSYHHQNYASFHCDGCGVAYAKLPGI